MRVANRLILLATLLSMLMMPPLAAVRAAGGTTVYLPLVSSSFDPYATVRRINAPYFNVADIAGQKFSEMGIFWFGRISQSNNYVDVRIGYNDSELVAYLAIIDRYIWYDLTPSAADLTQWDAVSLYLSQDGNSGSKPTTNAYRFDVQYSGDGSASYRAAYRGNGSGWTSTNLTFTTFTADRWENGPPNGGTSKGWAATLHIPFSSLGIARPNAGSLWGLAVVDRDRDTSSTPSSVNAVWPEAANGDAPSTWGVLRFGLPVYTPPSSTFGGQVTIRHRLNGATVPDANVGGYTVCGGNYDYWTEWGNTTWSDFNAELSDFNIQNQSDISDWPCFAKYYITFPLGAVPAGKVIRQANLILHQFGNSDPANAKASLIQVASIAGDWDASTITWNNAPLALENSARGWVDPLPGFAGFPGVVRTIDVSYTASQAYLHAQPLRLVLYSADSDYDSGKYFVASNTGDWNAVGRPTLQVEWGNP